MKIKSLCLVLSLMLTTLFLNVNAQLKEVDFIKGGFNDAQILFKEYLTPWANILGADLNGGWYNTAKPHKPLGFDLTISLSTAWAPSSAGTFDLSDLDLTGDIIGSTAIAPTVAGKKTDTRPLMRYSATDPVGGGSVTIAEYTVPNGTGVNFLPLPMGQLGIGLPFGTELTGRFLPNIALGDAGNVGLWGVGIKHSIMQWIPVLKKLPVLDITAQGGYTSLLTYANLNIGVDDRAIDRTTDPLIFKNQKIELGITAFTVNLLVSETLPFITFYQGIGYSSTTTNVGLKGNFPVSRMETSISSADFGEIVVTDNDVFEDPFNVEMENSKDLRLNAGLRLKLGIITIHFDYTKANYSVFTTGLGISFR